MRREQVIQIRVSNYELEALRTLSRLEKIKITEFVRNLILERAKAKDLWPPESALVKESPQ